MATKTGQQLHEEALKELEDFRAGRITVEEVTPITPEEADILIKYYEESEK